MIRLRKLGCGLGGLLLLVMPLYSADLTTRSGRVLAHAALETVAAGRVLIVCDEGEISLPLTDLPDNFLVALSDRQRLALQKDSDLVLVSGKTYRRITVLAVGNHQLRISYAEGEAIVPETELPPIFLSILTTKQRRLLTSPMLTLLLNPSADSQKTAPSDTGSSSETAAASSNVNSTSAGTVGTGLATGVASGGRTIYTGPRGGHYYINSKGNKVYVKSY